MTHATVGAGEDLRSRIVDVAFQLFAERGFAGTSIRDIAERLSVTKAALYYYFSSKEMILEAVVSPMIEQMRELAETPEAVDAPELIARFVSILAGEASVLPAVFGDPSAMRALKAAAEARSTAGTDVIALVDRLAGRLAGREPDAPGLLRARCALGAVHGGIFTTIAGGHAPHEAKDTAIPDKRPVRRLTDAEQRQVTACALAALAAG